MSKRQRPSSPIPIPPETQVEDESNCGEAYEPSSKRRRYFAPATPGDFQSRSAGEEYDSEDSESREGRSSLDRRRGSSTGRRDWGVYKDANSLLHDLHAEQRHRMLFSTTRTPLPCTATFTANPYTHSKVEPAVQYTPLAYSAVQTDKMEAASVTNRYENSNRCASIFLFCGYHSDHRFFSQ